MEPVKLAMIGCGENAKKSIVKDVNRSDVVRFVAAMDIKIDLAKDLAAEAGAPLYTDSYGTILDNPDVEAVVISTPHALHVPLGIQAARKEKHVLIDKPIATRVTDAQELIKVCRDQNVYLSVLFGKRLHPAYDIAADLVEQGAVGRITSLLIANFWQKAESYWSGGYTNRVQTDWRQKKEMSGGGMLMINYTHDIDALQNRLGLEPQSVFAQYDTFNTPVEVEDCFSIVVRYTNGAIGTYTGSSGTPGELRIEPNYIFGTEGTIAVGNPVKVFTTNRIPDLTPGEWTEIQWTAKPWDGGSYLRIIENFARTIRGEDTLIVTGENAMSSLKVIEGAYRSQELGQPVTF
ncbi:MAG: Gfo/Idh/MocA family oxidoreductase [Anaerolineae bacterium]|nr:Gfo/Idh/MocA family oxidoreductase [Anaerolineae bacterium]